MKMKKLAALALSAVFALGALTACGGSSSSGSVPAAASASGSGSVSGASLKEVNIGLIQLMEHASLDEIRTAIEAGLEAKGAEYGVKVNVDYQNAQGDTSTINTICQQFVGNKVDAIVAIATPAAQGAATAVAGTDIPVIFSAVTDPAAAGLVENLEAPEGNITGTSDAIPVEKIFELAAELTPDAESFGLIYNTGEVNSVSVIDETKAYLDAQGISYTGPALPAPETCRRRHRRCFPNATQSLRPSTTRWPAPWVCWRTRPSRPESPCMWRPTAW